MRKLPTSHYISSYFNNASMVITKIGKDHSNLLFDRSLLDPSFEALGTLQRDRKITPVKTPLHTPSCIKLPLIQYLSGVNLRKSHGDKH